MPFKLDKEKTARLRLGRQRFWHCSPIGIGLGDNRLVPQTDLFWFGQSRKSGEEKPEEEKVAVSSQQTDVARHSKTISEPAFADKLETAGFMPEKTLDAELFKRPFLRWLSGKARAEIDVSA
jgi:hypothetical protein